MNHKYVVSRGIAQGLKILGFPQETDFYWEKQFNGEWELVPNKELKHDLLLTPGLPKDCFCAAPHVGELGEWLPGQIILNKRDEVYLSMSNDEGQHRLLYEGLDETGTEFCWDSIFGETEADARATMLLWLDQKKLIKPKLLCSTQK